MNKPKEHNELDQFLHDAFDGHTIEPGEGLWEKIEPRLSPSVIPIQKYSRLKVILYSSIAVIAGLVAIIIYSKTDKTSEILPQKAKQENVIPETKHEKIYKQEDNLTKNIKNRSPHKINEQLKITKKNIEGLVLTKTDTTLVREILTTNLLAADLQHQAPEKLASKQATFSFGSRQHLVPVPFTPLPPARTTVPISTKKKNKINHSKKKRALFPVTGNHSKNSLKKFYAHHPQRKGLFRSSKGVLENFELKAVFTPLYSSRFLNNQQNIDENEFEKRDFEEMESAKITLNGGFDLAYNINTHWSISSGLHLYNLAQKHQIRANNLTPTEGSQFLIPTSAGTLSLAGSDLLQLSSQDKIETNLKFRYLNVPLIFQYRFNWGGYINSGVKYSMFIDDKTKVNISNPSINYSVGRIPSKKNHLLLSMGGGIDQIMHSGIRFELGPEVNFSLKRWHPTTNVYSSPFTFGIRLGLYLNRFEKK